MNKKGFTLVELLATLTILVLMSLVVGVNITSIMESTDDMEETSRNEQIAKAACVFVDSSANTNNKCKVQQETPCTDIKVVDLTSAGLLGNDIRKLNVEGSLTGEIKVCYKNNEKICEYGCTGAECECQ